MLLTVFTIASSLDHCAIFLGEGTLSVFCFAVIECLQKRKGRVVTVAFQGRVVYTQLIL